MNAKTCSDNVWKRLRKSSQVSIFKKETPGVGYMKHQRWDGWNTRGGMDETPGVG